MSDIAIKDGSVLFKGIAAAERCGCCVCRTPWANVQELEITLSFSSSYRATAGLKKFNSYPGAGAYLPAWHYIVLEFCPSKFSGTFSLTRGATSINQTTPWSMSLPNGMSIVAVTRTYGFDVGQNNQIPYLDIAISGIPLAFWWKEYRQTTEPSGVSLPSSSEMCGIANSGFEYPNAQYGIQYPSVDTQSGTQTVYAKYAPAANESSLLQLANIHFRCSASVNDASNESLTIVSKSSYAGLDSAPISLPHTYEVSAVGSLIPISGGVDVVLFDDSNLTDGDLNQVIAQMTVESVNLVF